MAIWTLWLVRSKFVVGVLEIPNRANISTLLVGGLGVFFGREAGSGDIHSRLRMVNDMSQMDGHWKAITLHYKRCWNPKPSAPLPAFLGVSNLLNSLTHVV